MIQTDYSIRTAEERDIPALQELYNYYITHTATTFDLHPVDYANRLHWFKNHPSTGRHRLLVAESTSGEIIGYTSSSKFRDKAAYDTSVESSIYLRPGQKGKGIGSKLYTELFALLALEHVHRVYACITIPNPESIALHKKFDFKTVGTFTEAGYKFNQYRDIMWMEKALS